MVQEEVTFRRLREKENRFFPTSTRDYSPLKIDLNKYTKEIIEFSHESCWGAGHFKSDGRDRSTIFKNSTLGKFGEFALYEFFLREGYQPSRPDMTIKEKGKWDDGDLDLGKMKFQIKSTFSFGNLLILKKGDYDSMGRYIHGNDGNPITYDAFFLCRMKPTLDILEIEGNSDPGVENLKRKLENVNFRMDVAGYIKLEDFLKIISMGIYVPKGSYIGNGERKLQEDLYYCQSGDLRSIKTIRSKKK